MRPRTGRDDQTRIAWSTPTRGYVWVERWGPKWLDFIGVDPLRRCVVGAQLYNVKHGQQENEQHFQEIARLSELRDLDLNLETLTSDMAASLGSMRRLRIWRSELTTSNLSPHWEA